MTSIKQFVCGTAVAGLVAGAGAAVAPQIARMNTDFWLAAEHVLLIGVDGTNLSKILEYAYNNDSGFKMAMDNGITGSATEVNHTTISGPSWSTILTGVWDDKHGVVNNLFRPEPYDKWPTVFNMLEYYKPEINTSVIADWDYINGIAGAGSHPVDHNTFIPFQDSWANTDAQVTAETIAQIMATQNNPDDISSFLFSYQVQVDEAGHGFGGGSAEYAQAVMNVGANIKDILEAIEAVKAITGDDWSIIITTDHGHQQSLGFGHGFQSPNETTQFVIFDQAGGTHDGAQSLNYSIADITPTILALFGVPMRSDFDGVSMTDPSILNGIVQPDDLKQALLSAIAMYGYPNIGNDIMLAIRTIVTSIPYGLNLAVTEIDKFLQGIVDQDIFLISGLAEFLQQVNNFAGGLVVDATDQLGRAIAYLTGSGVIAPTDPPLGAGSAESTDVWSLLGGDHRFAMPELPPADLDVA